MRFGIPISENREDSSRHHEGVRASIKHIVSATAKYAGARIRLLALETKMAAGDVKKATVLILLAACGALTGIILLIAGFVLWIATLFLNGSTAAASALTGVLLLAIAFVLGKLGTKALQGKAFFQVTRTELNRDKQWLHNLP